MNNNNEPANGAKPMLAAALSVELNNEMIAEFMSGQEFHFIDDFDREHAGIKVNDSVYPLDKLEYHSSWDWLMPVVEKIEKSGYEVIINDVFCEIFLSKDGYVTGKIIKDADEKIKSIWLCVVDFIYWHNGNSDVSKR
jgi:hypothetical protein